MQSETYWLSLLSFLPRSWKKILIRTKMAVKLEIQLISQKEWNQKVSQMTLKSILSHFQIVKSTILSSNQEKGLNGSNFTTLGKISEDEQIEIIKLGFQLQAEGRIFLKKYYESTDLDSLFQWKGYCIKYKTIRCKRLFQQLKPSNN